MWYRVLTLTPNPKPTFKLVSTFTIIFQVEEDEKSISLSPQLTPTVNFKLIKNSYLGYPYTKCEESLLANKYRVFNPEEVYKKRYRLVTFQKFIPDKFLFSGINCQTNCLFIARFTPCNSGWFHVPAGIMLSFSICEMRYLTEQVYTYCKCCPNYMHDQIFNRGLKWVKNETQWAKIGIKKIL